MIWCQKIKLNPVIDGFTHQPFQRPYDAIDLRVPGIADDKKAEEAWI